MIKALTDRSKVAVLFYASWCPLSRRFLPVFEKYSNEKPGSYLRALVDDDEALAAKYSVDVYPTVLFFENGKVTKRLDGVSGAGLREKQLTDFIAVCGLKEEQ